MCFNDFQVIRPNDLATWADCVCSIDPTVILKLDHSLLRWTIMLSEDMQRSTTADTHISPLNIPTSTQVWYQLSESANDKFMSAQDCGANIDAIIMS